MGDQGAGRRAQITVFIMVGLLLVVLLSLLIFFQLNVAQRKVLPLVPPEVQPVYQVVDDCVQEVGEAAIRRMSAQAGYLDIPSDIGRTPTSYVLLDDQGSMKVPMWWYDGQDRTPGIPFMEQQLQEEIKKGALACINDFDVLADQFIVAKEGEMDVKVTLAEENVVVRINYPLKWTSAGKEVRHQDFSTILDVRYLAMWRLANMTMQAENKGTFLENVTIDLMAMDPDVPMDGLELECDAKRWQMADVRDRIMETLRVNIPTIRFRGTNYLPFDEPEREYEKLKRFGMEDVVLGRVPENVPPDAYEYLRLFWNIGIDEPELRSALTYQPAWGMALAANPHDGNTLKSKVVRGNDLLNLVCLNTYHFTYDVIYPVLLTVRDDSAFAQEGATFQMAFPVQIRTNEPDRITFGVQSFRGFTTDTGFCEDLGDEFVDLRAEGVVGGASIATELDDVTFTLRCVTRECLLGTSAADEGIYRLRTFLPQACEKPTILASKEGYLKQSKQLVSDTLTVPLDAVRSVNVDIQKHPYSLTTKSWSDALPLTNADNVSIRIQHEDFEQFILYPANDTVQLVDGIASYDVSLLLTQFGDLTGGYVAKDVLIDGSTGRIVFNVLEGRPVGFSEQYYQDLATFLYGTDYQERLAPETS